MDGLMEALTGIQARFSGRYALYAEHLATGEVIRFGDDRPMETASCIKLAILVEAFRQAELGRLALSQPVVLEPEDQVSGSGVLQHVTPGTTLALRDVLELMITISDNTATNMVIRLVGLSSINTSLRALGLSHTRLLKRIDWELPGPIGYTVPSELALLLKGIYRRRLVSEQASAAMWDILRRQQYHTLLTRRLPYELWAPEDDRTPPRVQIGSKSGAVPGVRNDAGLVLTPWGDYVIAILSDGCQDTRFHVDNEALVLLPEVSRLVFDHFVGAGWRRERDGAPS